MAAQFEAGKTYSTRSACDYNCIFVFKIVKRTAKQLTFERRDGELQRCGIKTDSEGNEYALPMGRYSMAPVIRADEPKER